MKVPDLKKEVERFSESVKNFRVAVIGETIQDEFIYVSYEGQSMKSICPVFRIVENTKPQMGGAAAIANHLRDFVKSVHLFSNKAGDITKTRYVDISDRKKHVELNRFDTKGFKPVTINTKDYDVVIVADFGHGFCSGVTVNDGFHLMCQTNSNNFGFNRISKWQDLKKRSVCLDLREASLQMNRKIDFNKEKEVTRLYNYEMNTTHLFLTIGAAGSLFTDGKKIVRQESFPSEVVDTIGAGDAFFAFASLASAIARPANGTIMRIPALAASLTTTWMANEHALTRKKLMNYADRFIR